MTLRPTCNQANIWNGFSTQNIQTFGVQACINPLSVKRSQHSVLLHQRKRLIILISSCYKHAYYSPYVFTSIPSLHSQIVLFRHSMLLYTPHCLLPTTESIENTFRCFSPIITKQIHSLLPIKHK